MFARFARVIAGTVAIGLAVGGLIGGVGGRLAMRILVITSDDSLKGVLTDDDEVVNRFTLGGTTGLIIFLALGGAVIALTYLVLKRWLPMSRSLRGAVYGLLFFGLQGRDMFDPDGLDFTILKPHWLAVLMFAAILFSVGYVTVIGVDWALDHWPEFSNSKWYAYAPLVPLALFFPIFVPIAVGGGIAYLIQTNEQVRQAWESRAVTVVGQALLMLLIALAAAPTLRNVQEILTQ